MEEQMSKQPREFWIKEGYKIGEPPFDTWDLTITSCPTPQWEMEYIPSTHVIEYSAYQELVIKAEALITALKEARYEVLGCSEEWAQKSAAKIWQAIAEYKESK